MRAAKNNAGLLIGTGDVIGNSDLALKVSFHTKSPDVPNLKREQWIPRSVIHDDSEVYGREHTGKVVVMQWWAEKELGYEG